MGAAEISQQVKKKQEKAGAPEPKRNDPYPGLFRRRFILAPLPRQIKLAQKAVRTRHGAKHRNEGDAKRDPVHSLHSVKSPAGSFDIHRRC